MIIRSEQGGLAQNDFINTVDAKILKAVWDGQLTKIAYSPDKKLTNGLVAAMAVRIGYEKMKPDYRTLKKEPDFSADYARDWQLVCEECVGTDKATAEFCKKSATVEDALAIFSFYTMKQAIGSVSLSDSSYSEVSANLPPMAQVGLKFAKNCGICFYADGGIGAKDELTMRAAACILLQLDEAVGIYKSYASKRAERLLKRVSEYPANYQDYVYILDGIPAKSYETPLISAKIKPAALYEFAKDNKNMFEDFLSRLSAKLPSGVKCEWSYYPSLASESGSDLVIRAGFRITENPNGLTLNEIFVNNELAETMSGNNFLVDISVGERISDIIISTDKFKIIRAFYGLED